MMKSINGLDATQELLIKLLEQNPDDWGMRKKVVWFLYEAGYFREASKVVWNAPEIPSFDREIVFAVRVIAKGQPTRAMRLLNAVLNRNIDKPEKNLAMAKALVKGGMPLQAVRFYGAATLGNSDLVDEDFEVCMITADSDEEDWNEVVQSESFPWDEPVELTEADLECDEEVEKSLAKNREDSEQSDAKPVGLKMPIKSLAETVKDEEKVSDLREPKPVLPLKPDKISTEAVTMVARHKIDSPLKGTPSTMPKLASQADIIEKALGKKPVSEPTQDSHSSPNTPSIEPSETSIQSEVPAEVKKGMFGKLMGFFKRSKNTEGGGSAQVAPSLVNPAVLPQGQTPVAQPQAVAPSPMTPKSVAPMTSPMSPMSGPVKPKPVSLPAELQSGGGGRKYGQPEALDCRTRLVALAPQDGTAYFNELKEKYAGSSYDPEVVKIAAKADVDYLDYINKACSNDKAVNLEAFSTLLGLHAVMTEADCSAWVDDMNLLRQGFGDAVLATVVSKYSVSECRDILAAVYRRTPTKAAI